MKHIYSCSFGKDSLAQIILAHENNLQVDYIVYCEVMFDHKKNISAELPEHRDFIYNVAIPKIEKQFGYKVIVVKSELDFKSEFHRVITKGKHKGMIRAFPIGFKCCINRDCKLRPIKKFYKSINDQYIQYVGIAADEPKRLKTLHSQKNKVSLLEKFNYTEKMAYDLCEKYGLLSPIYKFTARNGCWFCPNQRMCELDWLYKNHNKLFKELVKLQDTPNKASEKWNRKFTIKQIEKQLIQRNNQISIFDKKENKNG